MESNNNNKKEKKDVKVIYIIVPFIHKSYGKLYDVIECYDVMHMSNNSQVHNNCIATCLQWKICLHKADLQETKNSFTQHQV